MMKSSNKIILMYILVSIILALVFFQIIPTILNYPPDSINNEFQSNVYIGLWYIHQYLIIVLVSIVSGIISLKKLLKKLDKIDEKTLTSESEITKIFNLPYRIYILQILIPFLVVILLYAFSEFDINIGTLKLGLIILTFETLISLIVFIYCKNTITKVLEKVSIDSKLIKSSQSLKNRMFLTLLPMILVALIFTSLIGYSRLIAENSTHMAQGYKTMLKSTFKKNTYSLEEAKSLLKEIEINKDRDTQFILFTKDNYITLDNSKLSDFFIKYTLEKSEQQNGRTYDTYAEDTHGVTVKINVDGEEAYVGIEYKIASQTTIINFIFSTIALFLINLIVLYYFSKSLSDDITKTSKALKDIVKNENIKLNKNLPITSNDEIGELVGAFNQIQDLTKNHIKQIEQNQEIIVKQAQFASLGEIAGGIAHDLNSPLMAIRADLYMIKKYIQDEKIVPDKEMSNRLLEIVANTEKSYDNMSKTINSVRDQIRSTGDREKQYFKLKKLVDAINMLMFGHLKRNSCTLNINISDEIEIFGEENKLDRVLTNLIKNSIDAYKGLHKNGVINIWAETAQNDITIYVKDEAGGIPEQIKSTLFKEMKTTKEQDGTGFGLYYAYRIVEGEFEGQMTFETNENGGTTFIIKLPKIKKEEI